jgi:hypothetical protein
MAITPLPLRGHWDSYPPLRIIIIQRGCRMAAHKALLPLLMDIILAMASITRRRYILITNETPTPIARIHQRKA